jgi:hypothetical protein
LLYKPVNEGTAFSIGAPGKIGFAGAILEQSFLSTDAADEADILALSEE